MYLKLEKEKIKIGQDYNGYKLSYYENGALIKSSYLNIEQWKKMKETCDEVGASSFIIGARRSSESDKGWYNEFGKMILKNCRFYTRALSDEEIKLNYDTRQAYDG